MVTRQEVIEHFIEVARETNLLPSRSTPEDDTYIEELYERTEDIMEGCLIPPAINNTISL